MGKLYIRLGYRRLHREEGGFTLVEMAVALMILFIVMTSLAYTAIIAFKSAGVARQRETAMGFSVQYYQEALALPFANLKYGLNPQGDTYYSSDANIVTSSTTCSANGANAPCVKIPNSTTYESLVVNSGADGASGVNSCGVTLAQTPPLCPHKWTNQTTQVVAGSAGSSDTYTSVVYVTKPTSTVCSSCYRLIVASSWTDPVDPGASSTVTYQSLVTNTSGGCLGTSSHPFSGPCPTYLFGQALVPQGTITVKGNTSGGTSINGINMGTATVTLPVDSTTSQTSQISSIQALGQTSGVSLGLSSSTATTVGNTYLPLASDNDPTLPDNSNPSPLSLSSDTSGSVSAIVGSSTPGSTSAASCGSTTVNAICMTKAVSDSSGNENTVIAGNTGSSCTYTSTGVPCGASSSKLGSASGCTGTMSSCVVLHLYNGATDLGTCTLLSVGAPSSTNSAQVNQNTSATPQPETAAATRYFGQITAGCIPSNVTPPTSWNVTPSGFTAVGSTNTGFFVGVKSGYAQSLQAQAGVPSPTTSSTNSGTEWYYSPGTTTVAGGTLSAALGSSSNTLTTVGTLNSALAIPAAGAGTLSAALGNTSDTTSSIGTVSASSGLTTSTTSFDVSEASAPPATPFEIKIDSEKMYVTANPVQYLTNAGNPPGLCAKNTANTIWCYTVTRAYNGTSAATHANAASVLQVTSDGCPSPCSFNVVETRAPSTGTPFTIQVDSEQMQVTGRTLVSGSTYTYTATRPYNSTTAATHASGASVTEQVSTCPTTCNFDVNESSTPPATPFTIQIDSEQMQVTARARYTTGAPSGCVNSSTLWCYSVTRAYNSTTGATHSSGATVSSVTAGCPSPCTFNVVETSSPPSGTPFTIQIDSEQMQVTSRTLVSGSTYTYVVTRAYNSTTAATHSSGATVNYLSVPFGYTTQTDSSASGTAMTPTSVNYTTGGCTYKESLNGSLNSPSGSVANTSTSGVVTNSAGTMAAPLTGDFKFNVTCGSTTVADLDIAIALGTMKTTATYSAKAT